MRILDSEMMQNLSFPDMGVEKMEFSPKDKELSVFVEGGFLRINDGEILGRGVICFNNWESLSIRRFSYALQEWSSVSDDNPEQLGDLCEVIFNNSDVSLCGFGKTIGQWMEWKITKTKMSAQFEDKHSDF